MNIHKNLIALLFILFGYSVQAQNLMNKYNLMPWPKEIQENTNMFSINPNLTISIKGEDSGRVNHAVINFLRRLSGRTGVFIDKGFPNTNKKSKSSINIYFDTVSNLTLDEDESYTLTVTNKHIAINAKTDIGAIRGIETLLQLTSSNKTTYYFPGVNITDKPRFVWRGLMIDAARHFQPIDVIKRNLDAMASVKLNVFHWHLTDDHGFRVASKIYPKLQELASDGLFYTQEQVKEIVAYASLLGIRVVPEFDVPGHASAILTAYPNLGSKDNYDYQIERFAGVFNPTLNPSKEETYQFLNKLFTEMASLFPDAYFHIGGDENAGKHWNESEEIQNFKNTHGLKSNHDLQTYFNIRLEKILKKSNKFLMGWDEIMTKNMPTTAVIHSWRGKNEGLKESTLIEAAKKGYQTVLSNGYYIDRMLSVTHHYSVDPIGNAILTDSELKNILGGEATMWSELVTPLTIDSRIWPRTAAISERFWSPKEVNDINNMLIRLEDVNHKLEELGLTHLKNKSVILRNLTNYQNISSLTVLSNICEPLKVYSRNKGGTEYKTFSPFTLFADACNVDASEALKFHSAVTNYLNKSTTSNKNEIISFLDKWICNQQKFSLLKPNRKLNEISSSYENLANASKIIKKKLSKKISKKQTIVLEKALKSIKNPFVDVEFAIYNDLKKLATQSKN